MRVHTYAAGSPRAVTHPEVTPDTPIGDLVEVAEGEQVYRLDDDVELDLKQTSAEAFGDGPGHVVVHHCHEVTVTVAYAGTEKQFTVRPSSRIKKVRAEAVDAFGLDKASSADLVLRLPDSTEELPTTSPIGAYVPKGTCAITLDLVHLTRPQG